jgi:hypothetical protein
MNSTKTLRFLAIVVALAVATTGCGQLTLQREKPTSDREVAPSDSHLWGRPSGSSSSKTDSMFFNEKSREIEKNLGY